MFVLTAAAIAGMLFSVCGLVVVAAAAGGASPSQPSALARTDIPPALLPVYVAAASSCGMPWVVLAAAGKVESDHGRSELPGVHSGANSAGAEGPMQFEPATWA